MTNPSEAESRAKENLENSPSRTKLFLFAGPKRRPGLGPTKAVHGTD